MINVIGVDGAGKRLLSDLVAPIITPLELVVSWGVERAGALNGQPRVDGLQQLKRFREAGLNTPDYTTYVELAKKWLGEGLVFGRQFYHTEGRDITGPGRDWQRGRFRRSWLNSQFWVKVVPDVLEEWRIHVFRGKAIARGLKWQAEPPIRRMPVRNRKNGWLIRHDVEPMPETREAAKRACAALGYDFGAFDLLLVSKDPYKVHVLEGNKSPGLDNYTGAAYAKAIERWVREQI